MTLYPGVRCYVKEAFAKSTLVVNEVDSFMRLCDVCDLLKDAWHCRTEPRAHELADRLEVAVPAYLAAFLKAFGLNAFRFKHHQMMHLAEQVRKDLLLLSCWVLERKHISAKQCFAHYKHATLMPGGALARMVNHQVFIVPWGCTKRCRPLHVSALLAAVSTALIYIYIYIYMCSLTRFGNCSLQSGIRVCSARRRTFQNWRQPCKFQKLLSVTLCGIKDCMHA